MKHHLFGPRQIEYHYGKAVGLGILYNDTYVMVNSGADLEFSNLRKFTSLFLLDQAIQLGAKVYDAGSGAFGWKEDLRLSKKPQYILDLRNK